MSYGIDKGFSIVRLGPLSIQNMDLYKQWRNHSEVYRWCRQDSVISDYHHQAWFDRAQMDPAIRMFQVESSKSPVWCKPIGVCGLTSIDVGNRRAEFSLYIAPEEQNKGWSKPALKTLFAHGFEDLNLNLIWGECFEGNLANNVFEQLGMVKEGTRRQFYWKNGRYIDAHLYSMTFDEFKEAKPKW